MKKYLIFIGIGVILLMVVALRSHRPVQSKALAGILTLPKFELLSVDSSHLIRSEEIAPGRTIVFFYFDPNCEHCQKLTAAIVKYQEKMRNVGFYFLSSNPAKEIDSFKRYYHLDLMRNVFVGTDYQFSFFNAFLPSTIPYVVIYNSRRRLAKIFNGEADVDSIIEITKRG